MINNSTHIGMNTYLKVLREEMEKGIPIGPKNHLYDRQLKEWEKREPAQVAILKATKDPVVITTKPVFNGKRVLAQAIIATVPSLRSKYLAEQKTKLADAYKVKDVTDDIKSNTVKTGDTASGV